jgi:hypothetical protein
MLFETLSLGGVLVEVFSAGSVFPLLTGGEDLLEVVSGFGLALAFAADVTVSLVVIVLLVASEWFGDAELQPDGSVV